jgi:hypothetical protein
LEIILYSVLLGIPLSSENSLMFLPSFPMQPFNAPPKFSVKELFSKSSHIIAYLGKSKI